MMEFVRDDEAWRTSPLWTGLGVLMKSLTFLPFYFQPCKGTSLPSGACRLTRQPNMPVHWFGLTSLQTENMKFCSSQIIPSVISSYSSSNGLRCSLWSLCSGYLGVLTTFLKFPSELLEREKQRNEERDREREREREKENSLFIS
jgi:hypothetical protein